MKFIEICRKSTDRREVTHVKYIHVIFRHNPSNGPRGWLLNQYLAKRY